MVLIRLKGGRNGLNGRMGNKMGRNRILKKGKTSFSQRIDLTPINYINNVTDN
jgi:hypothetical protein